MPVHALCLGKRKPESPSPLDERHLPRELQSVCDGSCRVERRSSWYMRMNRSSPRPAPAGRLVFGPPPRALGLLAPPPLG